MSSKQGSRWIWVGVSLSLLCATIGSSGCASGDERAEASPEYLSEIETWRAEREDRLRQPDGWLSLVGLEWLREGENAVGSAEGSEVSLPADRAPERLGTIVLADGSLVFRPAPGASVTSGGEAVTSAIELAPDRSGEPTVLEHGSLLFYVIERDKGFAVRVKDRESPALVAFQGMDNYPIDPSWRVPARLEPYDPPKTISVPNVTGTPSEVEVPAAIVFERDGESHRIDPVGSEGSYFLVFGDATNGRETYGGGRFLYADLADENGDLVLDFNRAYNPPCVFTPYATCPLPPEGNTLSLAVTAGEKGYTDAEVH